MEKASLAQHERYSYLILNCDSNMIDPEIGHTYGKNVIY